MGSCGGGDPVDTVLVTVTNALPVSVSASDCVDDVITLTASGVNTYTWTPAMPGLNQTTGSVVQVSPTEPTVYTVYGSNAAGCLLTASIPLDPCDPITLPVTWLGFQAEVIDAHRKVLCRWWTASEKNSERFIVQRSADVLHWEDIGVIAGAGNSIVQQNYELIDHMPLEGMNYYRVREVAMDGSIDHSEVRSVVLGRPVRLSVFPNPGTGAFQASGWDNGTLRVYDVTGRMVPFTLTAGGELTLHGARAGSYTVELRRADAIEPERVRLVVR